VFVEIEAKRAVLGAMMVVIQKGGGLDGLRMMGDTARRAGVTTTAELVFGMMDFKLEWEMHQQAVNDPAFPVRMGLVSLENPLYKTHGDKAAAFLLEMSKQNSDKLFFHGIKFLSDGSFPAMSLRLNFPGYLDGSNGVRNDVPWDELPARMMQFWKAGIQVHCHANGDQAIDASLDALAALQAAHPRFDHRFTIEHYCISNTMQARRLKALGGVASVNQYFAHYRSQIHDKEGYGPDRAEAVGRLATLEREGVVFALHSDFSLVVVPMHTLTAAWVAVNRIAADGRTVVAPGERIGVERALLDHFHQSTLRVPARAQRLLGLVARREGDHDRLRARLHRLEQRVVSGLADRQRAAAEARREIRPRALEQHAGHAGRERRESREVLLREVVAGQHAPGAVAQRRARLRLQRRGDQSGADRPAAGRHEDLALAVGPRVRDRLDDVTGVVQALA